MNFTYWKMGAVIAHFATKCQLLWQGFKSCLPFLKHIFVSRCHIVKLSHHLMLHSESEVFYVTISLSSCILFHDNIIISFQILIVLNSGILLFWSCHFIFLQKIRIALKSLITTNHYHQGSIKFRMTVKWTAQNEFPWNWYQPPTMRRRGQPLSCSMYKRTVTPILNILHDDDGRTREHIYSLALILPVFSYLNYYECEQQLITVTLSKLTTGYTKYY
jgi:hypothetical protein